MKERNSNIELLRIITMLLIILHHYTLHGLGTGINNTFNQYVAGVAVLGGQLGDDIFILISGYYMCKSRFTGRKLLRLWAEVLFYSVGIFAIFELVQHLGYRSTLESMGILVGGMDQVLRAVFPIGRYQYGFFTYYIVLMFVSPALNLVILNVSREQLLRYLVATTIIWSIVATLTGLDYCYSDPIWFGVLYLYGGYIRLYTSDTNYRGNLLKAAGAFLLMACMSLLGIYMEKRTGNASWQTVGNIGMSLNSPLTLLCSTSLVLAFTKMRPYTNRLINTIAGTTFGVYLIHANRYINSWLWKSVLGLPESVANAGYMIIHMAISTVCIFAICVAIELIRQMTVEKWFMEVIDQWKPRVQEVYANVQRYTVQLWQQMLR